MFSIYSQSFQQLFFITKQLEENKVKKINTIFFLVKTGINRNVCAEINSSNTIHIELKDRGQYIDNIFPHYR